MWRQSLAQRYGWYFAQVRIDDAFGRAMAQLDWAVWDAELALERTPGAPGAGK